MGPSELQEVNIGLECSLRAAILEYFMEFRVLWDRNVSQNYLSKHPMRNLHCSVLP